MLHRNFTVNVKTQDFTTKQNSIYSKDKIKIMKDLKPLSVKDYWNFMKIFHNNKDYK